MPGRRSPPAPPLRDALRLGPQALRHDPRTRFESPSHVGATPVADHPVEPFGIVTNLNQDLTSEIRRCCPLRAGRVRIALSVRDRRWAFGVLRSPNSD